ncbi:hypothetical protein B0F90DRAFT_654059 [Multifurca ochricompacta]|uniref:Uncharacterized protein n=1 Tax=Multifurca ochricompacta TaxID=376703 RepID=A0AAD4QMQ2_9AGAM|nr:hypothetical protein B0F90DRAFT_654059 [Multifurca ochricompacta]
MVGSSHPQHPLSSWSFYMAAILYDCITLSISTVCLLRVRVISSAASRLLTIMLYDGLGYLVVLTGESHRCVTDPFPDSCSYTAVNVMNVILFRGTDHTIQSTGASLGYTVTWIMSQRILTHIRGGGGPDFSRYNPAANVPGDHIRPEIRRDDQK